MAFLLSSIWLQLDVLFTSLLCTFPTSYMTMRTHLLIFEIVCDHGKLLVREDHLLEHPTLLLQADIHDENQEGNDDRDYDNQGHQRPLPCGGVPAICQTYGVDLNYLSVMNKLRLCMVHYKHSDFAHKRESAYVVWLARRSVRHPLKYQHMDFINITPCITPCISLLLLG